MSLICIFVYESRVLLVAIARFLSKLLVLLLGVVGPMNDRWPRMSTMASNSFFRSLEVPFSVMGANKMAAVGHFFSEN